MRQDIEFDAGGVMLRGRSYSSDEAAGAAVDWFSERPR